MSENGGDALVGRLIRSYRLDIKRNGRDLSQDGLIDLMIERGQTYAIKVNRSNVSRWETGDRSPPREFLIAFGLALNIPRSDINRMLALAGHQSMEEEKHDEILDTARRIETNIEGLHVDVRRMAEPAPPLMAPTISGLLWKAGPPGIYALAAGFILNALDLNGTLLLLAYVAVSLAIVVGQGALRWLRRGPDSDERDQVVDMFFISLFFTLNTGQLIVALTGLDHFGFYAIESFFDTPWTPLCAMLAHLALSLVASMMFGLLWRRQLAIGGGDGFSRAVWATLPPILFVYATILVFSNLSNWIYYLGLLGVMFGAFGTIVALNDPGFSLRDEVFVFRVAIVAISLLCAFGLLAAYVTYQDTDALITGLFFRIIPLPAMSADALGLASVEGIKRLQMGCLWVALANILYMAIAVGGYLLATIRRVGRETPAQSEAHASEI